MLKADLYTIKGEKKGNVELPQYFSLKPNLRLISQAVRVYVDRSHPGLHKVKTRSEIQASTRKIYRQKGTGKARHGALSAPIFVGGGIAHGPKGIKKLLVLSGAQKRTATRNAYALKFGVGKLIAVSDLDSLKKTKDAYKFILSLKKGLSLDKNNISFSFVLSKQNVQATKYLRNLKNCSVELYSDMNAYKIFFGGILVMDDRIFSDDLNRREIKKNTGSSYKKTQVKAAEKKIAPTIKKKAVDVKKFPKIKSVKVLKNRKKIK